MSVKLEIAFDGTTPGLEEHRLSLSAFAEPLTLLLAALQRTASAILASASEDPEYGSRGGKLADAAKLLDLELASVEAGSARPVFVCTARAPSGSQSALPGIDMTRDDLAEAAVERLLRDIDAESAGKPRSASARRYLRSLPPGITSQRYTATSHGKTLVEARFEVAAMAEPTPSLPRLIKVVGDVLGVGFEPGQCIVSVKAGNKAWRCTATSKQVDSAIRLRGAPVELAVLDGEKPSVVWIRALGAPAALPTTDETIEHLHTSWEQTLTVLAR